MRLDRSTRVLIEVVVAILAVGGLMAGVAVWRLSQGPLSLSFLTPQIETALSDAAQPMRIELQDTVLAWSDSRRSLDVRAVDIRAYGPNGALVATAPEVSMTFSLRALLQGIVAPTRVELIGPAVRLARAEDGSISFGVGARGSGNEDTAPAKLEALGDISDPERSFGYLRHIRVSKAELIIDDARTGALWSTPRVDILLVREDGALHVEFDGEAEIGGRLARVSASGSYRHDGDTLVMDATASGIDAAALSTYHPALAPLAAVRAMLSGNVHIVLAASGSLRGLWFDATVGEGSIAVEDGQPAPLQFAAIHGAYVRDPDRIVIDRFEAALDGPRVTATASASRSGDIAEFQANFQVAAMPVAALLRYWPPSLAPNGRRWVGENMTGGSVNETRFVLAGRADLANGSDPEVVSVNGEAKLSGVTVHYLRPLPPVRNVNSDATFTMDQLEFTIKNGDVGPLRVPEGKVKLSGFNDPDQFLALELVIAGPIANTLALLDNPRLNFMKGYGIDPATSEGMASTRLALNFELIDRLTFDQIDIKTASNLVGAGIKGIAFGRDISNGTLTVRADKKSMEVSGEAQVDGIPTKLRWLEAFDWRAPVQRRYDVSGTVDAAARKRLGVEAAPYLDGPVAVQLSYIQPLYKAAEITAKLGLDSATLAIPQLNWSKPPGAAGTGEIAVLFESGRITRVTKLAAQGGGLNLAGKLAFGRDGKPVQIDIERFALGETDMRASLKRREDGSFEVAAQGASLDLRPYFARKDSGEASTDDPVAVSGTVDFGKIAVGSGPPLGGVAGWIAHDGKTFAAVQLAGKLRDGNDIWVSLWPRDGDLALLAAAADAGEALRAFGVSDRVHGGKLDIQASRARATPDGPLQGRVVMREFSVADAPSIARVFAMSGAATAPEAGSRAINFGRLEIPFTLKDDVLTVNDGRGVASNLGLTGSGTIDLAKETIELDGTLVPAYMLNSILGNIPILGTLLTGEKGSGVFAATYRAEGSLEDPKVSVNPLAALTPGFLRKVFDIFGGGASGDVPSTLSEQPGPN